MPAQWLQVREWRDRADELRQAAEGTDIPSARDGLIRTAENFERMANELEERLKQQGIQPPAI